MTTISPLDSGLLNSLATLRGFVMEHELLGDPETSGSFEAEVLSDLGENLGSRLFDDSQTLESGDLLLDLPDTQSPQQRTALLDEMELVEARLLCWLLDHAHVDPLLMESDTPHLDQLPEIRSILPLLRQTQLSNAGSLPANVALQCLARVKKVGLSRKHRSEVLQEALALWRERPERPDSAQHDQAIVFLHGKLTRIRSRLVEGNIRLVASIVKRYRRGMNFQDGLRAGLVGFARALDAFEPDRGNQLSTYATWWIRQGISRAVANHGAPVRVPVHVSEEIGRLLQAIKRRWRPGVDAATALRHAADVLEISLDRAQSLAAMASPTLSTSRLGIATHCGLEELLFDASVSSDLVLSEVNGQDAAAGLILTILRFVGPEEGATAGKHKKFGRQADVLSRRLGVGLPKRHTLEQIGQHYGVTRERIRQVESQAVGRVRQHYGGDMTTLLRRVTGSDNA